MLPVVLLLALAWVPARSEAPLPRLYCDEAISQSCPLTGIYLLREQPRYVVIPNQPDTDLVIGVNIRSSKLAILSPDFCEAFPKLQYLYASSQGIEILDPEALSSCFRLTNVELNGNQIKTLPENFFHNNFQLALIQLQNNQIERISPNQFERNQKLVTLEIPGNLLQTFPVSSIRNSRNIVLIHLESNDIIKFDGRQLLTSLPNLKELWINGNSFLCSEVPDFRALFLEREVVLRTNYTVRSKIFKMDEVEEFTCIQGQ